LNLYYDCISNIFVKNAVAKSMSDKCILYFLLHPKFKKEYLLLLVNKIRYSSTVPDYQLKVFLQWVLYRFWKFQIKIIFYSGRCMWDNGNKMFTR